MKRFCLILLCSAGLTGCSFAPKCTRPEIAAPAAYAEIKPAAETNGWKTAEPSDTTIRGEWWRVFGDTNLNALEEQVAGSNQTVAAAAANYTGARALVKEARSALFPTIGVSPSVTATRQSLGSQNRFITNRSAITEFVLPVDASWELDLWGRIRNSVKSSKRQAEAALADLENVKLAMQAELAVDWFEIRGLDEQKDLLESAVRDFSQSLDLTRVRHGTGIASDQDVAQAETQLNITRAQSTDLDIQRARFEHAIALLAGRPAGTIVVPRAKLAARPFPVPPGVPSALLERRPDIAAAERRVAAANAQIGVARAAYFPALTLGASAGFQSAAMSTLLSGSSLAWSLGSTLAETVFDAGRRRAITQQARAAYEGTVANYRETVLTAFQEVEDSLSTLRLLARELQEESAAVESSRRYLELANERYKLGIDSYLNVITAETTLLNNERTAVNLRMLQVTATVQLVKALGGGWNPAEIMARN